MTYPRLITPEVLAQRARPDETHAIRVELQHAQNSLPYTLHGKTVHQYLCKYDKQSCRHFLDIPESVWMADNQFLARNLQNKRHAQPLIFLIVPWQPAKEEAPKAAAPLSPPIPSEDGRTPLEKANAILAIA